MPEIPVLHRTVARSLHRVLDPVDLAAIFKFEHEWYLYYLLLLTTGMRPDDAAQLTSANFSWKRTIIGYVKEGSEKYVEVPVPQDVLRLVPHDHSATKPLFPRLCVDVEDPWIMEEALNERLGQPADFLEALLTAAGRPTASLVSFRITLQQELSGCKQDIDSALQSLLQKIPEPMEIAST